MPDPRTNYKLAGVVEFGIVKATLSTTRDAATFMASRDVPFEVALRTILHPSQRRGYFQ